MNPTLEPTTGTAEPAEPTRAVHAFVAVLVAVFMLGVGSLTAHQLTAVPADERPAQIEPNR